MKDTNILKTDSRGRITLPPPFRSESLFGYVIEGDQLTIFPVQAVRKYPDMSGLPSEELSKQWTSQEEEISKDSRSPIISASPIDALKKIGK